MTNDLLKKYDKLLSEFDVTDAFERDEHAGLVAFLSREDIVASKLAELVSVYWAGMNNGVSEADFVNDPTYRWVTYVADFERRGTTRSRQSREEIVAQVKEVRRRLAPQYLRERFPNLYEQIYGTGH